MTHCTIGGNATTQGGSGLYCTNASPKIVNSIMWNRGQEILLGYSSNPVLEYCCVQGGWPGEGNVDGRPLFVDSEDGDYHLRMGSACIDRGLVSAAPERDLDGRPRPGGDGFVDMGAYESPDDWEPGPESRIPTRWYVRANAPAGGDWTSGASACSSIGAALVESSSGDEVWIQSGLYLEAITLEPGVSLYGGFAGHENDIEDRDFRANISVINASGLNRSVASGADEAILDGLTLTGGNTTSGGGLFCYNNSSLRINNCIVMGNKAVRQGGGMHFYESSAMLNNCIIIDNSGYDGSGLYCGESSIQMNNCTVVGNGSGANKGGGIYSYYSTVRITNCIFWNPGDETSPSSAWFTVTYSNVEGGRKGEGNISSDPLFVHPWDGSWADLRLQPGSPCIDAGSPDVAYNDACLPPGLGGARCDMGAYGGPLNCAGVPEIPTPTPTPMPSPTPTVTPLPTWTPTVTPTATATPKMPPSKEHPQLWLLDGRGKVIIQNAGDRIQNTE
jgi:hypothetical protein